VPGEQPVVVSVLVPVLDEEEHIRDAVASMRSQELEGGLELIFVDGGSRDRTREILEELASADARVRVLDNPARRTPQALNIGLRAARGEFVARMDAHTEYPADYLARGVERLRADDVAHVSGPQLPEGRGRWSRLVALALRTPLGTGGAGFRSLHEGEREVDSGFTGVWRRSTLEHHGGWDEGWPTNQDAELAARIRAEGGRVVCMPEMAARYIPRDSLRSLARQYWRYGLYRAKTSRRHPASMRRSHVLAPGVALAFAASPMSRAARSGVALYLAAVMAVSVRASRPRPADAAALPAVFLVMHLSWGLGFLAGSLRFGPPVAALRELVRP
jgi:succinoglycan biosynthesis protein ExoA